MFVLPLLTLPRGRSTFHVHTRTIDLKQIPLAAVSASLTALKASEDGVDYSKIGGKAPVDRTGKALDAAGYESVSRFWNTGENSLRGFGDLTRRSLVQDGAEVVEEADAQNAPAAKSESAGQQEGTQYGWRFSKSPMGESSPYLDSLSATESLLWQALENSS